MLFIAAIGDLIDSFIARLNDANPERWAGKTVHEDRARGFVALRNGRPPLTKLRLASWGESGGTRYDRADR